MEVGLEMLVSLTLLEFQPAQFFSRALWSRRVYRAAISSVTWQLGTVYCSDQNSSACMRESFCHYGDVPTQIDAILLFEIKNLLTDHEVEFCFSVFI